MLYRVISSLKSGIEPFHSTSLSNQTHPYTAERQQYTSLAQILAHEGRAQQDCIWRGFFIFIFFISIFYKNIFSIWKFTEIYPGRPAAGRPGPGRPAAGRQGLKRKKKEEKNCRQVPGAGRPAAGRPAPPVHPAAGRPAPQPYIRCWQPLTPIWLTKNPEKKKREGGREMRGEGEAKRRSPVGFSRRRL